MFRDIFEFLSIRKILKKVYKDDLIPEKLSKVFNTKFKVDNIGRLYTIIHPKDFGDIVYNYDNGSMNSNSFMYKMIMDRMIACETITQGANIFDLLSMEIKLVSEVDNIYLIIFKPYNFDDFEKSIKKLSLYSILVLLATITGIIIF